MNWVRTGHNYSFPIATAGFELMSFTATLKTLIMYEEIRVRINVKVHTMLLRMSPIKL